MENIYSGMTVNERLYESGLMNLFDKSVKKKDVDLIRSILKQIEINEEVTIKAILKQVGL